jgi:hypothetical protein
VTEAEQAKKIADKLDAGDQITTPPLWAWIDKEQLPLVIRALRHYSTADAMRSAIVDAHNALDDHLGDTDADYFETDEEMRRACPDQWAAMRLAPFVQPS